MNYQLMLSLQDQPAVMERVLQTTRYRGFCIHQLRMQQGPKGLSVTMDVSGQQPIHILTGQLRKLYDLSSLEIASAQPVGKTA
ncbi:acetolactate synthase 2 small subunit [Aliiglaciecola sp. CAU 1673]|uniref:acetolactate synthase 2 small subunit n=1 Tax=Aliiglaciecola sp. CAU 1673 TaxID=3032595 RepID=UPI0023DC8613|nr:acetolactate synthase 2 small subunit [Aliiglaciecola sp. CAU 1673]MDF2179081.1 acetolactate synthase 2 small subunit [Aliiglaciecola sp. CAU 1673]